MITLLSSHVQPHLRPNNDCIAIPRNIDADNHPAMSLGVVLPSLVAPRQHNQPHVNFGDFFLEGMLDQLLTSEGAIEGTVEGSGHGVAGHCGRSGHGHGGSEVIFIIGFSGRRAYQES